MGTKFLRNMENIFEKCIEGFFNKKFSSGLQPVEIAKQLSKELESKQAISINRIYVPNFFSIDVSNDDYARMAPYWQAIQTELHAFLHKEADKKGYTVLGEITIEIAASDKLIQGAFTVSSSFTQSPPIEAEESIAESIEETRVFARFTADERQQTGLTAMLTVIDGVDVGLKIDIAANRVNIGRREGNELPLQDMNTSRLHAYINYEDGEHVLYDAKSLNGTYVDKHRITRVELHNNDQIKLGNTVILYEVK